MYAFATTSESLDRVVAYYRQRWPSDDPRSWKTETLGPLDVFDAAALFDRARLARVYGGTTPRIARGPIREHGVVTHAVLLVSPYPEPDLKRLKPGTLIMTVEVDQRPEARGQRPEARGQRPVASRQSPVARGQNAADVWLLFGHLVSG